MKSIEKRQFLIALIFFVLCVIGLYFFIDLLVSFQKPTWFYHPINDLEKKIAKISRFSLFMYFTYLSLFLYSVWGVLRFLAVLSRNQRLINVLTNKYLVTFLTANQLLTLIAYTVSQGFSAIPYGFINFQRDNFIGFLKGIYIHYVLTTASIIYFFILETPKSLNGKIIGLFTLFPCFYALVVKLVGLYAFNVEWYPYAIFSRKAIWLAVFNDFSEYNVNFAMLLIVVVIVFCMSVYFLTLFFLNRFSKKKNELK